MRSDQPEQATGGALIDKLVGDLTPVRPVRTAAVIATVIGIQTVVVLIAGYAAGLRPDFGVRASEPAWLVLISVLAVAAAWSGSVAVRLAMPGRDVVPATGWLLLAVPIGVALVVFLFAPWGRDWHGWLSLCRGCLECIGLTAMSAAVPWLATVFLVSRLAPLGELRVGMFAGFSAFLAGALVTELHCPMGVSYHLVFGHYLPVAVLSALTCLAAAAILRSRLAVSK